MKKLFTILFSCGVFFASANDSLKVKKVHFFIEPKVILLIPQQKSVHHSVGDLGTDFGATYSWQNKTSVNFGLSTGLSVRLCKHFYYEFAAAYNLLIYRRIEQIGSFYTVGLPNEKNNATCNVLAISNGISFKYKHFIINSSVQAGLFFSNVQEHGKFILISEHKIGYSFLKERLGAYLGINIIYNSVIGSEYAYLYNTFYWDKYNTSAQTYAMPFVSFRVNF